MENLVGKLFKDKGGRFYKVISTDNGVITQYGKAKRREEFKTVKEFLDFMAYWGFEEVSDLEQLVGPTASKLNLKVGDCVNITLFDGYGRYGQTYSKKKTYYVENIIDEQTILFNNKPNLNGRNKQIRLNSSTVWDICKV